MTRFIFGSLLALSLLGVTGCGGDKKGGSDGGDGDSGGENLCPATTPDREDLDPSCCYRASNDDRQGAPNFRVTSLVITKPTSLSNALLVPIIQGALDGETFNWLIQMTGADAAGEIGIRTGLGILNAGRTFRFAFGEATGDDKDRWNPVEITGDLQGETFNASFDGQMNIPLGDLKKPAVELPLNGLNIVSAEMSESRSCIGSIGEEGFDSSKGEIVMFITVEGSANLKIDQPPVNAYLCNFIANFNSNDPCTEVARSEWGILPDSKCDESGCTVGGCDGATDCNAWKVEATFSAAGVEITEGDSGDAGSDAN